ncbi:hypothetical protein [uncultured Nocardioides sp.]|uniref:hypothetical protein n=1 Tax=uncultured Nocardioides sp. TaxID=198441 RepID=UPI00262D1B0E|nr:hypothetical protein [uncultured Nocardioides sp.]
MAGAAGGLVLSDLDRTLVWSRRTWDRAVDPDPGPLVCVEELDGAEHAYVTRAAYDELAEGARTDRLVWVTTRTPDQLRRLRLPAVRHALCLNAGRLLVDGVEDADFTAATSAAVASVTSAAGLVDGLGDLLEVPWVRRVRDADGVFCYLLMTGDEPPATWWDRLGAGVADAGWVMTPERTKTYLTPAPLTKGAGVARLLERTGLPLAAAAGDSLLDADMLALAAAALTPAGSYLDRHGWAHPTGERTQRRGGPLAGEEVARWLCARL